jgi:hypothetical protein
VGSGHRQRTSSGQILGCNNYINHIDKLKMSILKFVGIVVSYRIRIANAIKSSNLVQHYSGANWRKSVTFVSRILIISGYQFKFFKCSFTISGPTNWEGHCVASEVYHPQGYKAGKYIHYVRTSLWRVLTHTCHAHRELCVFPMNAIFYSNRLCNYGSSILFALILQLSLCIWVQLPSRIVIVIW